jgi:hypothetical protein
MRRDAYEINEILGSHISVSSAGKKNKKNSRGVDCRSKSASIEIIAQNSSLPRRGLGGA